MELRQWVAESKQEELYDFLFDMCELINLEIEKQLAINVGGKPDLQKQVEVRIEELERLGNKTEEVVNEMWFNARTFGYPILDSELELYEQETSEPYAEY